MLKTNNQDQKIFEIGVIGLGSIGYTSLLHYVIAGRSVIGFDINPVRCQEVLTGTVDLPGVNEWVQSQTTEVVKTGNFKATPIFEDFLKCDPDVIFVAVPTEKHGTPSNDIVEITFKNIIVAAKLKKDKPLLAIVESTMTPGTTSGLILPLIEAAGLEIGKDILLGVSPRRDWFRCGDKSVKDMERVFGGITPACTEATKNALDMVCDTLYEASSAHVAELTKCAENAFRMVHITLANEFALAFPHLDTREVLELASTKWNMELYFPSLRVGGHCIPVAGRYLMKGSTNPAALSIVKAAVNAESVVIEHVIDFLIQNNIKTVAILGYSYRPNIKISIFSPGAEIIHDLINQQIECSVYDKLYSNSELKALTTAHVFESIDDLPQVDAIILSAAHDEFLTDEWPEKIKNSGSVKIIIDNSNAWKNVAWPNNLKYMRIGDGYHFKHIAAQAVG